MSNFLRFLGLRFFSVAFLLLLSSTVRGAELPPEFGWMRELAGSTWVGKFPDGKTVHSQSYEIQFGRFLRGAASLSGDHQGKQVAQFHGDSVFAWDAKSSKIVYYLWGSDGNHGREEAWFEGDRIIFPAYSKKEPGKLRYRSVWQRIDRDSFRVDREVPMGDSWKVELSVTYRRSSNSKPAAAHE
ncbi:MAG: hypothetical protein AB1813_00490 [Verrucomicrobiota bacterium]